MDADRWRLLEPLLDRALELAPEERIAWLHTMHVDSPDIAGELRALLACDDRAERNGFLTELAKPTLAGLQLGAYTLEKELGRGGMGSVWLARRTDGRFDGLAAVKLLNLSLSSAGGAERFRREGSLLARLTHSGIARLVDAGVSRDGQPYLVLEYVDGQRIDRFVEEHELPLTERVRLFLRVLDAVAHAHANLIVHRDLKPTNILVTGDGAVKLLDFGIAKLIDVGEHGTTDPVTLEGARAFTPEFAAPEQVRGEAITTATDVYALGVLLYVLLSGRHPTLRGARPAVASTETLFAREPSPLGLGDLDSILAKSLRQEPSERYQTAAEFSADLQRWLQHEPVSARADSLGYRARRFIRRHRAAMAGAAMVVLATAGYLGMVIVDRDRVRRALAEATTNARKAEQVTDFAVGLFEATGGGPAYADTLSAREMLTRAVARAHELSGQPAIEAQMLDLIGRIRTELGDYDEARPVLAEALAIRRRALGNEHPDVAASLMSYADLFSRTESNTQTSTASSLPLLREALRIRRRVFGDDDARTTDALYALASDLHATGGYSAARPMFDEWLTRVSHQPVQYTPERADQLSTLSRFMEYSGKSDRAERLSRQALVLDRALYGDQHDRVAIEMAHLGSTLVAERKRGAADTILHEAVAILRQNHPEGHLELANALRSLGMALVDSRHWDEAEPVWRESAELNKRLLGEGSSGYATSMSYVGYTQALRGHPVDGERTLRTVLTYAYPTRVPSSPVAMRAQLFLGVTLFKEGRTSEAEPLLLKAYRSARGTMIGGPDSRVAARTLVSLYETSGRPDEAAKYR